MLIQMGFDFILALGRLIMIMQWSWDEGYIHMKKTGWRTWDHHPTWLHTDSHNCNVSNVFSPKQNTSVIFQYAIEILLCKQGSSWLYKLHPWQSDSESYSTPQGVFNL
jgi:hypothetical protein